jgi:glutamine amidotransferase|tara:strand:+ start:26690 stop:27313 length:624 start_codon:yes stop_codon:yes gene_type:complete
MLAIVDYDAGNLRSVQRACAKVGMAAEIVADPRLVESAERIIFPGVGAATSAVDTLRERGLDEALLSAFERGTPILGICLGAQITLEHTEEDDRDCLGMVEGVCRRFEPQDPAMKVPHMGWNGVEITQPHPLLEGVEDGDEFYFVHSYFPCPSSQDNIYAVTDYGTRFCSALGRQNLFATQFHLEKSGRFGLSVLSRFAHWNGCVEN